MKYDYLIVGAGLYGSIAARELTDNGKRVLIIDKRSHIGGNCHTENVEGITVHKYGPHIFHTSDKRVWDYMCKYAEFNHFSYRPKVNYKDNIFSFPINLLTLNQLYGVKTPEEAIDYFNMVKINIDNPVNLEDWMISQVGWDLYNIFIKGYTTKQWGREPSKLPASIIKRIPIRLTYDDNYYFDTYQGIPIGGYTPIFEKLLSGVDVLLDCDYFSDREYFNSLADIIIYTGSVDEFYDYKFGKLDYRSLEFKHEILPIKDYQGIAGMNYTDINIPYTRIIEHKHFEFGDQSNTIITKEYPTDIGDPYYPISDGLNVIFGGRLADYVYYDMTDIVRKALEEFSGLKYL